MWGRKGDRKGRLQAMDGQRVVHDLPFYRRCPGLECGDYRELPAAAEASFGRFTGGRHPGETLVN